MDVLAQISAVRRELQPRQRDGREVKVLVAEQTYRTDIDDLWDALTNAERLPRWFLPVTGDLRVGGRYQFVGNAGGSVLGCDPPRQASLTWEFGGEVSWLDLRLTTLNEGVRLTLEHTAPLDPERWKEYGPGAVGVGWDLAFLGLGAHLASGMSLQATGEMDFLATEDGRTFVAVSSAAWRDASVAAGEDPEAASAAADRTTAAYTVAPVE